MLTIAVALATHDGGEFLAEQLDSLARQRRLPDELIVHDDCSVDQTVEIVERFARTAPFPVRLVQARERRGYGRAFLEAARLSRTDLVAFCDQDDIWSQDKLARCAVEIERRPDVTLVVHSARVIGDVRGRRGAGFPAFRRARVLDPAATPILPRLPGFAMVASRLVIDPWEVIEQPAESPYGWDHDDWTATIAAAVGRVSFLPDRLVLYRQHAGNVWGAPPSGTRGRIRTSLAYRGEEAEWYSETAAWARDHVRVLEALAQRAGDLPVAARDGPAIRARLWARLATVNDRRAELYAQRDDRLDRLAAVTRRALRGDYGSRGRGGLGASSLGRDLFHATGLLELVRT